jgi:hypothetical protein
MKGVLLTICFIFIMVALASGYQSTFGSQEWENSVEARLKMLQFGLRELRNTKMIGQVGPQGLQGPPGECGCACDAFLSRIIRFVVKVNLRPNHILECMGIIFGFVVVFKTIKYFLDRIIQ